MEPHKRWLKESAGDYPEWMDYVPVEWWDWWGFREWLWEIGVT